MLANKLNFRVFKVIFNLTIVLTLLIRSAAFPSGVLASPITRFVATTGADSGDCSSSPCLTITYAISQAVAGDTIDIAAGTYTEAGITVDKDLTLTGAGAGSTIVQAHATPGMASAGVFIINSGVTAIIEGVTIRNGNISGGGGGIENLGTLMLDNSTISGNSAFLGGGIDTNSGTLTLNNSTVSGNSASYGGGIYTNSGAVTLNNSTVSNNSSVSGGYGGGIQNNGPLTLNNSTVSGNTSASSYGGGIANNGSSGNLTLNNSTVSGNSAAGFGGGITSNSSSTLALNYSTVTNNTSDSDNTSSDGGGGGLYNGSGTTVTLKSSIVAGNKIGTSSSYPGDCFNIGTPTSQGYNLTGSSTGCNLSGTGDMTVTPADVFTSVLGALAGNGGSTQTHALLAGSPALDQIPNGTNSCGSTPFDLDQRSQTRPFNTNCDIGSFELPITTLRSVGANDGWVLESTETSNVGGTMNTAATTFNLGDNAADKQYRSILHFDTSSLPDTAVITKVTLKIKKQGVVGTDPFTILSGLRVDMRKPSFGTVALASGDFQAIAGRSTVATFGVTPVLNWYSAELNGAGRNYINKTGTTQFRLRFATDDNNNNVADLMRFFSGNAPTATRPQLIVQYYVP